MFSASLPDWHVSSASLWEPSSKQAVKHIKLLKRVDGDGSPATDRHGVATLLPMGMNVHFPLPEYAPRQGADLAWSSVLLPFRAGSAAPNKWRQTSGPAPNDASLNSNNPYGASANFYINPQRAGNPRRRPIV